jgi:hypothetical protein
MIRHPEVNALLTFVNDIPRNDWYREILQNLVKDRTVFEVGTGIGLLGAYCLEFGADHYYGVDVRSARTALTRDILDRMGYQGRHSVTKADFLTLTADDVPQNIDILLCEHIGCQFMTNATMKKIWSHANQIFKTPYISVPDVWAIDVAVYEGQLDNNLSDCQPRIMLNYDSLPQGFYDAVNNTNLMKSSETFDGIVKIGPDTCDQKIEFVLDLTEYKSATVVVKDHTSYQGSPCLGISYTTDWPPPQKLLVPRAGKKFLFSWDPTARRLPEFYNGFWTWQECQ